MGLIENYRSLSCRRAALDLTTISIKYNIIIIDQIHIAGVKNIRCDQLSRNNATPNSLGFHADQIITLTILDQVTKFCNPTIDTTTEQQVSKMWNELRELDL